MSLNHDPGSSRGGWAVREDEKREGAGSELGGSACISGPFAV